MKKLSDIISLAGKIAREERVSYPTAASLALTRSGFPNISNSVGISRVVNDTEVPNNRSLRSAVLSALGKKGVEKKAVRAMQARQTEFALA